MLLQRIYALTSHRTQLPTFFVNLYSKNICVSIPFQYNIVNSYILVNIKVIWAKLSLRSVEPRCACSPVVTQYIPVPPLDPFRRTSAKLGKHQKYGVLEHCMHSYISSVSYNVARSVLVFHPCRRSSLSEAVLELWGLNCLLDAELNLPTNHAGEKIEISRRVQMTR